MTGYGPMGATWSKFLAGELRITAESATGYCQGAFALRGRLVNFLDGFLPCVLTLDL